MKMTTFNEALRSPAHQGMWEAIHFLKAHEADILFPEKFLVSQKDAVLVKIKLLCLVHPQPLLKDALIEILKTIPDTVPSSLLTELTRFAIEQWERREELMSEAVLV